VVEDLYQVELTASFLERLDAIEAFFTEADAAFAFDDLLAELRATVFPNLARFPRIGRRYLDNPPQSAEALAQLAALPAGAATRRQFEAVACSGWIRRVDRFRSAMAQVRRTPQVTVPAVACATNATTTRAHRRDRPRVIRPPEYCALRSRCAPLAARCVQGPLRFAALHRHISHRRPVPRRLDVVHVPQHQRTPCERPA